MPFKFKVESPIMGFTAEDCEEGQEATVITRDFRSTDDGPDFIRVVEGVTGFLLKKELLEKEILPSQIQDLLAIIDRENNVTLYLNEAVMVSNVRVRKILYKVKH